MSCPQPPRWPLGNGGLLFFLIANKCIKHTLHKITLPSLDPLKKSPCNLGERWLSYAIYSLVALGVWHISQAKGTKEGIKCLNKLTIVALISLDIRSYIKLISCKKFQIISLIIDTIMHWD